MFKPVVCSVAGAIALLSLPAGAEAAIVSDTFTIASGSTNLEGTAPEVNLPGGTWVKTSGWSWGHPFKSATGTVPNGANMGENGTGLAITLASSGGYVKPTALTISADVMMFNGDPGVGGVGLGFFDTLNAPNTGEGFTRNNFTGLYLAESGSMQLYADGAAGTAIAVPVFSKNVLYNLSYDVDTTTGAISNIVLNGTGYSLTSTAFTDAATTYGAFFVSGGSNARGGMDNFVVQAVPEPAMLGLAGLLLTGLKRRR